MWSHSGPTPAFAFSSTDALPPTTHRSFSSGRWRGRPQTSLRPHCHHAPQLLMARCLTPTGPRLLATVWKPRRLRSLLRHCPLARSAPAARGLPSAPRTPAEVCSGEQHLRRTLGGSPRSLEHRLTTRGPSRVKGADESRGPTQVSGSFGEATGESLSQSEPRKEALSSQPGVCLTRPLPGGGPREVRPQCTGSVGVQGPAGRRGAGHSHSLPRGSMLRQPQRGQSVMCSPGWWLVAEGGVSFAL